MFERQCAGDDLTAGIVAARLILLSLTGEAQIALHLGEALFEGLQTFRIDLTLTRHFALLRTNHLAA
jgi:hypothetical protein